MSTSYFKALSDETRLRILNLLIYHELNVNEIVKILEMGQSRISRHLKVLTDSGLLSSRRDGLWIFYKAVEDGKGRTFINAIEYLLENDKLSKDLVKCKKTLDERTLESAQFFDSIAEDWEKMKHDILGTFDISYEILKRIQKCDVAVDLGCGTGDLLVDLRKVSRNVIGVDNSPKMLETARTKFSHELDYIDLRIGELRHLPLSNLEADIVVLNMVLHHLASPIDAIKEVYRTLKFGGSFIIVDFEKHKDQTMQIKYGDRWLGFKREEIIDWIENAGFMLNESVRFTVKRNLAVILYKVTKGEKHDSITE